jgi:hypothetical protein
VPDIASPLDERSYVREIKHAVYVAPHDRQSLLILLVM